MLKNYAISAINTTEDFLHLNVWVPTKCISGRDNYSVVVSVYGGGFMNGGNGYDIYDGRSVSAFGNVIVVAPNYRVEAFGFLNIGTKEASGNMAFHDVLAALKWVRKNIARFGGNPDSVLLMGQRAGAIMMSLLLMSPEIPKFRSLTAHLTSGSAFTPIPQNSGEFAKGKVRRFASRASSQGDRVTDMMECFHNMNSNDIVRLASREDLYFTPSYGDDVLPNIPDFLMSTTRFNAEIKGIMLANTYSEGNGYFEIIMKDVIEGKRNIAQTAQKKAFSDLLHDIPDGILDANILAHFGYNVASGY